MRERHRGYVGVQVIRDNLPLDIVVQCKLVPYDPRLPAGTTACEPGRKFIAP